MSTDKSTALPEIGLPDWLSLGISGAFTTKAELMMRAAGATARPWMGWAGVPGELAIGMIDIADATINGTAWNVQQQWQGLFGGLTGAYVAGETMAFALGPAAATPIGAVAVGVAAIAGGFYGEQIGESLDFRAASARVSSLEPGAPNYPYINEVTGQGAYIPGEYVLGSYSYSDKPMAMASSIFALPKRNGSTTTAQ